MSIHQDADATTSSFRLNDSVLQQAQEKIAQAEEDRRNSKLPSRLIPLVEIFLPPNYRLSQLEKDADRTFHTVFGACGFSCFRDTTVSTEDDEIVVEKKSYR